jgi:Uma2 family endonuclease
MAIAVPPFPIARFSVEQYHRMIESGAFTEDDRLELIEGWVVRKMAKGAPLEFSRGQTEELIPGHLPPGWHVRNQAPITLAQSEPEPDLTVARGSRQDYRDHHPQAADVALVVEVSDTTLVTDRLKGKTYAKAGIPEFWIVNLASRCIDVHSDPVSSESGEAGYRQQVALREGEEVRLVVDGQQCGSIEVSKLLP